MEQSPLDNLSVVGDDATIVIKNKHWTSAHEDALLILHKYTHQFTQHYHKHYLMYKRILYNYRIPVIVMSSVSSLLALSNVGYIPVEYTKYVSLSTGILNAIVVIINVIEHTKKIEQTATNSLLAYIGFRNISNELAILLRIPAAERENNGYEVIKRYYNKFQQLLSRSPVLKRDPKDILMLTSRMDTDGIVSLSSPTTANMDIFDISEDALLPLSKNNPPLKKQGGENNSQIELVEECNSVEV
jgi:hypothetical protein